MLLNAQQIGEACRNHEIEINPFEDDQVEAV